MKSKIFRSIAPLLLILNNLSSAEQANDPIPETSEIQTHYTKAMEDPDALIFTPPEGWVVVDPKVLSPRIKLMVIGKSQKDYPPSINLGIEPYPGTIKEYLKIIKQINESQGSQWKDLGMIKTQAGNASLSQVDMTSEWGNVRLMHVIIIRNGTLYILTAGALKEEFPQFYKQFFHSMTSLRFNKDIYEMVESPKKRNELIKNIQTLKDQWATWIAKQNKDPVMTSETFNETAFQNSDFQQNSWVPFKDMLKRDFSDMNPAWTDRLLDKIENELITDNSDAKKS
jgi:hypothetical protein